MKNLILLTSLFALVFYSCKKEEKPADTTPDNTPQWATSNVTSDMMLFLNSKAPAFNTYTVDATTTSTFTNDSIMVLFPPNVFVSTGGAVYTGTITVKMQTIRGIEDMIYSGVTTVAGNGELLISDGMCKLEAYDASNNKLKLKQGSSIVITFPAFSANNIVFKGSETVGRNNKVEWNPWDSTDAKRNNNVTLVVGLDSIFKYTNLDRYMTGTLTDITVTTPTGFTNKNTECFLRYTGENASAYIPAKGSIKAFSTIGNYYKVVESKSAKIICFSKKDGKFYYQIKTIPSIGSNQTVAMDAMVETTQANLEAVIASF